MAKEIFVASVESHYLVMAANRISLLTDIEKAAFLSPILLADNNNNRTRLCANLLAGNRQISTNVAIRICAIADKKCDLPPFNKETVNSWIAEMQGPYTQSIRKKFLTLRDRPVNLLLTDWETLSDSLKEWVLIKLIKDSPSGYEVLLTTILQRETSVTVLSCALSCIQNSSNTDVFNDVISILLKHENEKLRAQAVFCYQEDTALLGILDNEKSPVVIANILLKISTDHELIPLISGYFSHPQWQVRAAAAQSFVNLAPESIKTLKELFYSDDLNVRTSAIRCLNELKMEQWIKENLSAIQ
ncbi:HEAT repeat domain-containing protein [Desulfuromusa kysingii]|uniref:HEAT repeat domain-containing protein n=1 Tax=Desulfuromusa kysingii TaxID=37625 RepID=UPI0015873A09|nr:HEAT repeat domain-containing protein [Desulfuromusa kysingii]